MSKGSQQHQDAIKDAGERFTAQGHRFIQLGERPPRFVGTNGTHVACWVTQTARHVKAKGWHVSKTAASLRRRYIIFDEVVPVRIHQGANRDQAFEDVLSVWRGRGWRIMRLAPKCPDGLILKEGKLLAYEMLLMDPGERSAHTRKLKALNYQSLDGVVIETETRRGL